MYKLSFLSLRKGDDCPMPCQVYIHDQVAVIGREASDLMLEDPKVSRQHVALVVQGREVLARDLNSRNGLMVNGRRVLERVLQIGDKLKLGDFELTVTEMTTDDFASDEARPERDPDATIAEGPGAPEFPPREATQPAHEDSRRSGASAPKRPPSNQSAPRDKMKGRR